MLVEGLTYAQIGERLGVPAGQAYLIATGISADGSGPDTEGVPQRPWVLPAPQSLSNPPHQNPTRRESVHRWTGARAAGDAAMQRAAGMVAATYEQGTAGRLVKAGKLLSSTGVGGAMSGRRNRVASAAAGAALLAASACRRFGIFLAGTASARDPKNTVVPQRERLDARRSA